MADIILEFEKVNFKWEDGPELNDINLKIKKGAFVLINGPSGSGKSTLLRIAARLEDPNGGVLYFNGVSVTDILPETLRKQLALIQQTPTVLEGTVKNNLLLPFTFEINKSMKQPDDEELKKRLKELYLEVPLDKEASTLSVGQKQRLCILRTLLLDPSALLMDEPTSALDPESKIIVEKISEELNRQGTTIIMVSHSDYRPSVPYTRLIVNGGKVEEVLA